MAKGLKPQGKNVFLFRGDHAVMLVQSKGTTYEVVLDLDVAASLQAQGYSWSRFSSSGIYFSSRQRGRLVLLHRVIAEAQRGDVADHVDGNTLNNRKSNLRKTNQHINGMNRRRLNKNNKSGVRGVYFIGKLGRWVAEVRPNNKRQLLGYFDRIEDATAAVDTFMRENFHDCGH